MRDVCTIPLRDTGIMKDTENLQDMSLTTFIRYKVAQK